MSWTWQGILTSVLATLLLGGVSYMFTWARNKWPKYGDLVRYWLIIFAVLSVLVYTLTGYVPFAKPKPPEITASNIEQNIKQWCESLGLPFAKGNMPDSMAFFSYSVTSKNNQITTVARTKDKPNYLQFLASLNFSPEHQAILGTLTKDQVYDVMQKIELELARTRVGSAIATVGVSQSGPIPAGAQTIIQNDKAIPIDSLNEYNFGLCIDDVDFTVNAARAVTNITMREITATRDKGTAPHS